MKAFIVISDQHTGHENGLQNPDSKRDDGKPLHLRAVQESLWAVTEEVREYLNDYKRYDKWLIHLGEVTQGIKHVDNLVVTKPHEQIRLAIEAIEPFLKLPKVKGARFMQATTWHEFEQGTASRIIAENVKVRGKLDVKWMHRSRLVVDDLILEFTHHGPSTSKRKYLEGNSAFLEAKDRTIHHLIENKRVPDVTFTAHTHKPSMSKAFVLSEGKYHSNTHIITPPMCGPGAYSRKVANPDMYYIGMHVILIDKHGMEVVPFFKRLIDYDLEVLDA